MSAALMNGSAHPGTAVPALIVLGRDEVGRSHASWFDDAEATLARKAAGLMNMAALPVVSDELRGLARRLPHGRVFDSGKAFVPFVKGDLYRQLMVHLSVAEKERLGRVAAEPGSTTPKGVEGGPAEPAGGAGNSGAAGAATAAGTAGDWNKLKVGSVVIALENEDDGWWEAVIVKIASDNLFTLRWRDYPDLDHFVRTRKHIALLHPDHGSA